MSYRDGADFERELVVRFRAEGWVAHRAAGSKGTADVFAFSPGRAVVVNAKTSGWAGPSERNVMASEWHAVEYVIPVLASRRGPRGYADWRALNPFGLMVATEPPWEWLK